MKTALEQQMKEALNGASLNDMLPGFDMEHTWQELQGQLTPHQPASRVIRLGWVKYAAAVLLILIGCYAALQRSGSGSAPPVAVQRPGFSTQLPVTERIPAHQYARTPLQAVQPSLVAIPEKKIRGQSHAAPAHSPALPAPQVTEEKIAQKAAAQSVAAVVTKDERMGTPKKVTHYLDIDSETPEVPARQVAAAPFVQMKLNKPGTPSNSQQKPFKELAFALGR